jgi:cytoskeletal protein CcmA (bactofilin family)/predicted RNA-binding Zn-ribbon protein involved in translation (DUF1610 family)
MSESLYCRPDDLPVHSRRAWFWGGIAAAPMAGVSLFIDPFPSWAFAVPASVGVIMGILSVIHNHRLRLRIGSTAVDNNSPEYLIFTSGGYLGSLPAGGRVRIESMKSAFACPHCGFIQQESVAAKSTFCRKCQQHYNLERMLAGEKSIVKEPGLFSKLTRMVLGDRQREVTCFTCGHQQKLSKGAQSTMCPECGAYMDLRDFKIAAPFGRSVQTAGDIYVSPKGDVTSTKMMCGALFLEGNLRGHAIVTGTATVKVKGRLIGTIDAPHILVEKRSELEFARPVRTKLFEVSGTVRADVHADKVVINKGGWLEGSVSTLSITVSQGGVFSGDLFIGEIIAQPKRPSAEDTTVDEALELPQLGGQKRIRLEGVTMGSAGRVVGG